MQILKRALRKLQGRSRAAKPRRGLAGFETAESRCLLSVTPLQAGAVYVELDTGADTHGDLFELTFRGGAPGTQLSRVVIDGDQQVTGFGVGDVFFDTLASGYGGDDSFAFELGQHQGIDSVRATVPDGQTQLVLDFVGFDAGEYLTFMIDVDEVEDFDPDETDLQIINEGFDPITSGVEFQGSSFVTEFIAPDFFDISANSTFRNRYDAQLANSGLPLPADNFQGRRDRSAGAFVTATQLPIPASISGYVYHDRDDDGRRDAGEEGIQGVQVRVEPIETVIDQLPVTVTTDANGYYQATELVAGRYRVVEIQNPAGYLDGQDAVGTVGGVARGIVSDDLINEIRLHGGDDGIEFNFGELLPVTIRGRVQLSTRDGDCFGSYEQHAPVADARVLLYDANGNLVAETRSDADGRYEFSGLRPGTYRLVEMTPDQLLDGGSRAGQVAGTSVGTVLGDGAIIGIAIASGQTGVRYDFCEHVPASVSGFVYHDRDDDGLREPGEEGIPQTVLRLIDAQGRTVAETTADSSGFYAFTRLTAGSYSIIEEQPAGWVDGLDAPGTIDGTVTGIAVNPGDRINTVRLLWGDDGVEYNFGEIKLATLTGRVQLSTRDGDCFSESRHHQPVAGAVIRLVDVTSGRQIAETITDQNGEYRFSGLRPGTYRIEELTPPGLIDGGARAGTVSGNSRGRVEGSGIIGEIRLWSDETGVRYDFCEHVPASVSGFVYHDRDDDGLREPGEEGIPQTVLRLIDAQGRTVAETTADSSGFYAFTRLTAGSYSIIEEQPAGWVDGLDAPGTIDGTVTGIAVNPGDRINTVRLLWGDDGVEYNFGEIKLATLTGRVQLSTRDGDCFSESRHHQPVAGAVIRLVDVTSGRQIAETITDQNGEYRFSGLRPGTYRIEELTPPGLIDGGARAGTVSGNSRGRVEGSGIIGEIRLWSGESGVRYDFCEHVPAQISGYVYHDREQDGSRDANNEGISNVVVRLVDDAGREVALTTTDEVGFYEFRGLVAGSYALIEEHPLAWQDGIDTVGTIDTVTVGRATNPGDRMDGISLLWGDQGLEYNFGEYLNAVLSGRVQLASRDGDCFGATQEHAPVANAVVRLYDQQGLLVEESLTDADGRYQFTGLAPGTYRIVELTPDGLFDGGARSGTIAQRSSGNVLNAGTIAHIRVRSGDVGTRFDFCELPPAMLSGHVYHDRSDDGQRNDGEEPIAGVLVELLDDQGNVVAQTVTAADGQYKFAGVRAGTYMLREAQPAGWSDGLDTAGFINGLRTGSPDNPGDKINGVVVGWGDMGTEFNFGELLAGSITGIVHTDIGTTNCVFESSRGELLLSGVTIELWNESGDVIATTATDTNGRYSFAGLRPANYRLRQIQPTGYFDGAVRVGSHGGDDSVANEISAITIASGQHLTEYNFCEMPPVTLSGFVFQDGDAIRLGPDETLPERIRDVRDGQLTPDDTRLAGVTLELRNGVSGRAITNTNALPGIYADGPIRVRTDARGYYEFQGIRPGTYAIYEAQPDGFVDGVDTPGTASGVVFNPGEPVNQSVLQQLSVQPNNDAIVRITLPPGAASTQNNFSEVTVTQSPPRINLNPPEQPPLPPLARPQLPPEPPPLVLVSPLLNKDFIEYGHVIGNPGPSWHLSIVDGGSPRGAGVSPRSVDQIWLTSSDESPRPHDKDPLDRATWIITTSYGREIAGVGELRFGLMDAVPIVGDFNGDGYDEIGVYHEGNWYFDSNGNGRWDADDLWSRLGDDSDQPVTGDWNGDGKDDIGIFGPRWPRDSMAIANEPGLPDKQNTTRGRAKNIPPAAEEATDGYRIMRKRRDARLRVDLIDHVFHYGRKGDQAVAGDWNGDGITSIGVFRAGSWFLDVDGNGRWTLADRKVEWGSTGDQPIVGDFDGDGVDELAFFRDGRLYLDRNHNGELDGTDEVIDIGRAGDIAVAGDFNGDGVDEIAVYRAGQRAQLAMRKKAS